MASAAPGYSRPISVAPLSPEAEGRIAHACPGAAVASWPRDAQTHPYWGPWRGVFTGAATDAETRFEGSSGGVISALLIHALKIGLVDRVLHVTADQRHPTRNVVTVSRSSAEILNGAGSRYTASSPLEHIDEALAEGGTMAFVGKPCDASALRRLGQQDPRIALHVPLVLSFFCGGIPSHDGVQRILQTMGADPEEVTAFRYRGRGWPGNCVAETAGGSFEMSYAESWGAHLSKEVQFRCKICPDAVGGVADIACADAWYGDDAGYPSFAEEEGRSLIITRTEAGEQLLASALAAAAVEVQPLEIGEVDKMQPAQARRKRLVFARTVALRLLMQPQPRMRGQEVTAAARRAPLVEALRNLLGTAKRTLNGRRSRL